MTGFDPHSSWLELRARAARTTNPQHRRLLEGVANHMEAEIKGQLEPLMATLIDEPVYHFWRVGGENMVLEGYDAVAGFYRAMFDTNGQQFHVVVARILVDDSGVVTEGQVRQVYGKQALQAMGLAEAAGEPIDAHDFWLSNAQLITVWPAGEDDKLVGEDIYFGEDPFSTLTPISADVLPDYFIR